ncbi:MAG: hypothetical protein NXH75_09155 [Halobacteriovoraceae bacterium]|nr:hypothetical protein [Halobacteriovoraceae bacterium]
MKDTWFTKYPIAHRGWHWLEGVDENSYEAIDLGIQKDLPIEFDVYLSKDGVPYIHHDPNLKRMTGQDLYGPDLTSQELKHIKTHHSEQGIPLLKDVLNRVRGKVPLVIELKRVRGDFALEEALLDILKDYKGEFSIQGFHPGTLNFFRKQKVGFPLGMLSGSFVGEELHYFLKVMLKSLCLSPFLKPDYIGYEWDQLSQRAPQEIREKYEIPLLGWTVKDSLSQKFVENWGDNIIFENLAPISRYNE